MLTNLPDNHSKRRMELKDKILNAAYGKVCVTPGCVDGDKDMIQAAIITLSNEGLVNILGRGSHGGKSSILNFEITEKGTVLVNNGGYAKLQKKGKRKRLSRKLENALYFMLGAATTAIVERLVGLLFDRP